MIMNCKRIQRLLERYLRDELTPTLRSSFEEHLGQCKPCRQALEFHQVLDLHLNSAVEPPPGLRARFDTATAVPAPRRSWLIQTFGDPTMRTILISSTLVTAVVAMALFIAPSRLQAATAHEKFVSMRTALTKAFRDGELTISATLVNPSTTTLTVLLDGSPLPPDVPVNVAADRHDGYTDYTVKIDFSDGNFKSISFGKDENTLKLVPKASPNLTDIVRLDPKTGKPLSWTEFKEGSTQPVTTINYKGKAIGRTHSPSSAAPTPSDGVVTAHVRINTK